MKSVQSAVKNAHKKNPRKFGGFTLKAFTLLPRQFLFYLIHLRKMGQLLFDTPVP